MAYTKEKVDIERSVYNWMIPNFGNFFNVLNQRKLPAHTGRRIDKGKRVDCSGLELVSEKFMRGQVVQKTSTWQLELRRNGTYLCIGLSCLECVHENCEEIWTRFDLDIVNCTGEVLYSQGSGMHFCNDNLTKFTPLTKIGNKNDQGRAHIRCSFWEADVIPINELKQNWNKLVPTNNLKLRLRLYIYRDKPLDEASQLAEFHEPVLLCYTDSCRQTANPFLTAVKNAWESGDDSDITFEIEGEKINAHKFVVSVQSPVLKKMTENTPIEIKETSLPIFRQLLKYLYTQEAVELKASTDIDYITKFLDACNRFEIPSLARICLVLLLTNMNVENFPDIAFTIYSRVTTQEQSFFKTEVKRFFMLNQKELQKSEAFQKRCMGNPELFLQLCFHPVPLLRDIKVLDK